MAKKQTRKDETRATDEFPKAEDREELNGEFEFEELRPFYDRLENSARKGLQEFSEKFIANKVRVHQAVVYGQRTHEIIDFAIQNRMDLIIMASHRIDPDRPGHDWSSISYAVAILSPCPVLLIK